MNCSIQQVSVSPFPLSYPVPCLSPTHSQSSYATVRRFVVEPTEGRERCSGPHPLSYFLPFVFLFLYSVLFRVAFPWSELAPQSSDATVKRRSSSLNRPTAERGAVVLTRHFSQFFFACFVPIYIMFYFGWSVRDTRLLSIFRRHGETTLVVVEPTDGRERCSGPHPPSFSVLRFAFFIIFYLECLISDRVFTVPARPRSSGAMVRRRLVDVVPVNGWCRALRYALIGFVTKFNSSKMSSSRLWAETAQVILIFELYFELYQIIFNQIP